MHQNASAAASGLDIDLGLLHESQLEQDPCNTGSRVSTGGVLLSYWIIIIDD